MMRYTTAGPAWVGDRFLKQQYVSVWDGQDNKGYYGRSDDKYHPMGFIRPHREPSEVRNYHIRPILLAYRALDPMMGGWPGLEGWTIESTGILFEGRPCVVLGSSVGRNTNKKYWIDPARNYSIVRRIVLTRDGKVEFQSDIQYKQDSTYGWVPNSWNATMYTKRDSRVIESCSTQVQDYAINTPIPKVEFQLSFPPGTEVTDYVSGEDHMIREDGSILRLMGGERRDGSEFYKLVKTRGFWSRGLRLALLAVPVALLVAGLWLLWRRQYRSIMREG